MRHVSGNERGQACTRQISVFMLARRARMSRCLAASRARRRGLVLAPIQMRKVVDLDSVFSLFTARLSPSGLGDVLYAYRTLRRSCSLEPARLAGVHRHRACPRALNLLLPEPDQIWSPTHASRRACSQLGEVQVAASRAQGHQARDHGDQCCAGIASFPLLPRAARPLGVSPSLFAAGWPLIFGTRRRETACIPALSLYAYLLNAPSSSFTLPLVPASADSTRRHSRLSLLSATKVSVFSAFGFASFAPPLHAPPSYRLPSSVATEAMHHIVLLAGLAAGLAANAQIAPINARAVTGQAALVRRQATAQPTVASNTATSTGSAPSSSATAASATATATGSAAGGGSVPSKPLESL